MTSDRHQLWHTDREYEYDGAVWLPYFLDIFLTILWEIVISVYEFYMLKSNIDVFFVTSFLCSLKFLLFQRIEYPKGCLCKTNEIFLWLSFCERPYIYDIFLKKIDSFNIS